MTNKQRAALAPYQRPNNPGMAASVVTRIRYRVWCAEFIGWPALAQSWRKDLAAKGKQ